MKGIDDIEEQARDTILHDHKSKIFIFEHIFVVDLFCVEIQSNLFLTHSSMALSMVAWRVPAMQL